VKKLLIVLLILYSNFKSFADKETPITVKFQKTLNTIKSGENFTMSVEVASIENFKEKITTSVILPIGWKVIEKKNPEKTVGLTWVKYVLLIDVPDFVPTGKYQIAFKVLANDVERKVKNQTVEVVNPKLYTQILDRGSLKKSGSDTLKEINRKIIDKTITKSFVGKDSTEYAPKDSIGMNDTLSATYNVNFQETLLKLLPGKPFTIFVEVISNKNIRDNIEPVLNLPTGWNILIKKTLGKTKGVNVLKYMYTLTLPSLTPSGTYNIGLRALINNQEVAKNMKGVEVITVRGIEITPLNTPEYVKEGDTLRTEYLIQNLGNNTEKVGLKTGRGRIKITGDSVEVKSNESVTVIVEQIIPVTDQNSWNASSDIYVHLKDSVRAITSIVNIPVFSTKNKKSDPYLRFPLEVGVWYSGATLQQNRYVSGLQYDVRGKGFLDFGNKHYLDFVVHGPNRFNLPAVGSFDQYSLSYSYKNQSTVTLGDYGLRFSNLLEYGRFGRGAKYDQEFKHLGFSVFYLQPRFFPNQRDSYGGKLTFKFNNLARISADFYSKDITFENNNFTTNFYGISSIFENKTKSFLLETELVVGTGNNKVDYGGFNRLTFRVGRLQVNSNFIYAGKNFYGFFNNSWLAVNGFTYNLSRKINIGFSNNITRLNPSFDATVINTSPYSSGNVAFLNYEYNANNRFTLSYNDQEREDRGTIKTFHFKENFARLSYNVNAPKFTLWFNSQYGVARNLLLKSDSSVNRQSLTNTIQPQFRVVPWFWLGGYFEYQRTSKFSDNNRLNDFYFYGGLARINMGKKFNLNFMYRNSYAPDELIEKRSFLDLGVTLDLDRHVFSIQGGRTFIPNYDNTEQNSLFFVAKYTFRIGVPVVKNRNLGSIRGQILGLSQDIKKDGVLVRLGERKFLTDPAGNFYFNNLLPDKYYVTMERSTMGVGVVANAKIPMEVIVRADSTQQVTIPLTKTGEIKGKIDFVAIEQVGTLDINKNKPLVLVKMMNGKESYVTQVNKNDEFSFKEIKPDKWKITAWIPGKQEQFDISNSEEAMVLGANQVKEVQLVIKPIVRKINFSQKTYNLSSKK
jgi:hypothetical protein